MPDSLLTQMNEQMGAEDRKAMQELREAMQKQNAEKLAKMEEDERELEAQLAERQALIDQQKKYEKDIIDRLAKRERIDKSIANDANNKINA